MDRTTPSRILEWSKRRIGPKLLAALFVGTTATAGLVYASPNNEVETTYYSDAEKTVQVGYARKNCDGTTFRKGRTSAYSDRVVSPCDTTPDVPPNDTCNSRLVDCP